MTPNDRVQRARGENSDFMRGHVSRAPRHALVRPRYPPTLDTVYASVAITVGPAPPGHLSRFSPGGEARSASSSLLSSASSPVIRTTYLPPPGYSGLW